MIIIIILFIKNTFNKEIKRVATKRNSVGRSSVKTNEYYIKNKIKWYVTDKDMVYMIKRDKPWSMERPSIDRINPKKNYELKNCRFMELSLNISRSAMCDNPKKGRHWTQYF